jgi:DNA-binding NarL/FixJ family response regulator
MNMQPALARAMDVARTTQKSLTSPQRSGTDGSNNLTARELEISGLLAHGMSNREGSISARAPTTP